ncbi:hypothetical protein [Glutamicibacter sp. M10]|uniref:hypothetical protein n=1 Tax=Glutamicibacter sp. M10 TaxID=3023076 RepID=UPI0021C68587|nr:hypothetical protein [Glutamicibacter sp. M10]UXN31286.1 hypothetical protein N6V40_12965 [Glutamicibacter sp. M10]
MKAEFSRGTDLASEERSIDLSFDGGTFVNWKVSEPISSLSLRAEKATDIVHGFSSFDSEDASYGVIDLADLRPVEYQIIINGDIEELKIIDLGATEIHIGTQNQGITNEHIWDFRQSEEGQLFLSPIHKKDLRPAVVSLDAGLGVVILEVSPLPAVPTDHKLFLRHRKQKEKLVALRSESIQDDRHRYVISADVWEQMNIPIDSGQSTWDLFISEDEKLTRGKRLTWRGSSTANPRETVRFRATTSWVKKDVLYRIRPYWTLDQFLALEITHSSNSEGSY